MSKLVKFEKKAADKTKSIIDMIYEDMSSIMAEERFLEILQESIDAEKALKKAIIRHSKAMSALGELNGRKAAIAYAKSMEDNSKC
jgi:hypothetical protein